MATTARFTGLPGKDNTDRIIKNDYQAPAYAATIALAINASCANTLIQPAALTGAATITANVGTATTAPFVGDTMQVMLVSDATTRTVTFGTGFLSAGTLAVTTAKYAVINFVFNGVGWLENGRIVSA